MKIDLHVHSTFSSDAKAPLEGMCLSAINKGLSIICFTEHFDMNPNDQGYNFFNYQKYAETIKMIREKYSDKIKILKGLEFAEPHLYKKELEYFNTLDFDFILGSIHWVGNNWIGDKVYQNNHTLEELFNSQYSETLKASESGLFDSLAHFDFPKRYLLNKFEPENIIKEILKNLIKKNISLEINTSPLRKNYSEYYPSRKILNHYSDLGGKYITVGSDAHDTDEIGSDMDKIRLNDKFKFCYYEKRKRIILK